jgi:hypothetical protein
MAETIDGAKKLFNDSKLGILAGFIAAELAMGVVEYLGTVDFSTWPTWLSTTAALAVGFITNAIVAWAAPRRRKATPGVGTVS